MSYGLNVIEHITVVAKRVFHQQVYDFTIIST